MFSLGGASHTAATAGRRCAGGFEASNRRTWRISSCAGRTAPAACAMHARNGRDPTGLRKRTTKVDLSAAFRTNGRRRIGAKAVASRKGNLRHGSGAKCHAPAASRQEAAADRRRRCMVRMNICGLLWLSERWDRDEMRDASRGDGLCATRPDPSTPGVIKMDDVCLRASLSRGDEGRSPSTPPATIRPAPRSRSPARSRARCRRSCR